MKQVTIICEAYALEAVKQLLRDAGAHGWTYFPVEGSGAGGERAGETREFANLQIHVILQPDAAEVLMTRVHDELFPLFAMIAYESEVKVIRATKF